MTGANGNALMQNQTALSRVRRRLQKLAALINAPHSVLPTLGSSQDFARPHIEAVGEVLYYVVVERGSELSRELFLQDDALLERVFRDVTFEMACTYEVNNRRADEDSRRQRFAHGIALLAKLDANWAARERERVREILRKHPFSDEQEPKTDLA